MALSEIGSNLLRSLTRTKCAPKNFELSKVGPLFVVAAYHQKSDLSISDDIVTGMDRSKDVALLKCLSEWVERHAMGEWMDLNKHKSDRGSEGFAAFPLENENAKILARCSAYAEAFERFTWAKWWDEK